MIRVTLYQEGTDLTGCRAKGHSGWADAGGDIICAAVSILTCTCVNALESVCGVIPQNVAIDETDGVLNFDLPERTEAENERAQILMLALKQGLSDLAGEYPENVELSIKDRRK
jgi:hypothetical protein